MQGQLLGPQLCSGLKSKYSNGVACQGVGGAYTAGLGDNASEKGTTDAAIREATTTLMDAMSKCPDAAVVAGGYRYVQLKLANFAYSRRMIFLTHAAAKVQR